MSRLCFLLAGLALMLGGPAQPQEAAGVETPVEAPAGPPPRPDPGELRRELQDVLAGPEFQRRREQESLMERVREALGKLWRKISGLLEWVTRGIPGLGNWPVVGWVLLAVALGLVLFLCVRLILPGRRRPPPPDEQRHAGGMRLPARDPDDLLSDAARFAESGNFREAIRAVYLASLVRLHRAGMLPRREANTNWEYLDAVRTHRLVHEPLSHLTAVVDRVWYGHQAAHDEDYSRCREFAGDVDRAIVGSA